MILRYVANHGGIGRRQCGIVHRRTASEAHRGKRKSRGMAFSHWNTVKPHYSTPAYNKFPPIEHNNFGPKKHVHSYLYVGNSENLGIEHNFNQSHEMR